MWAMPTADKRIHRSFTANSRAHMVHDITLNSDGRRR